MLDTQQVHCQLEDTLSIASPTQRVVDAMLDTQ